MTNPCPDSFHLAHLLTFNYIESLIKDLALPAHYRDTLALHLEVGRQQAAQTPLPSVFLPYLIATSLGAPETVSVPVASACTLVYLGADLFDNVADQELPEVWQRLGAAQANLSAATYLAALSYKTLESLETQGIPPERLWRLSQAMATGLTTMSAGQYEDILSSGASDLAPAAARFMVERKSGAEYSLFCRLGATVAHTDTTLQEGYSLFGLYYGSAVQLMTDLMDIWGAGAGRDLRNKKRTLPISYALQALPLEAKAHLLHTLEAASTSPQAQAEVRTILTEAGSLRYTLLIIALYRQRALAQLKRLRKDYPVPDTLESLVAKLALPFAEA